MSDKSLRYRTVVETTPDVVLVMDADGKVVEANPATERVLGYAPGEVTGRPLTHLMPERYRRQHVEGLRRYLRSGERNLDWSSIQLPGLHKDGREVLLDISFGEFEEDGRKLFTGILRDITRARKTSDLLEFMGRIAPTLASSALDYQSTLKSVARLAVPFLADWCAVDIMRLSGEIERLAVEHTDPGKVALAVELQARFPTPPDSPVGVPHVLRTGKSELVSDIPDSLLEEIARDNDHLQLLRSLGLRSFVVVPLSAHGTLYGALTLVQAESGRRFEPADLPLVEDLGSRAGMAIHNATLYKEALSANQKLEAQAVELQLQTEEAQALTEELEAQTEELVRTAKHLERKTAEADAANRAKSEFLANMSHELRTPLNAIGGYVQLLQLGLRGPITQEQAFDLERIQLSERHLLGLINDILNYAKLDAGKVEYRIEPVRLRVAILDAEGMVRPQIESGALNFTVGSCRDDLYLAADPDKLRQILLNLLSNAVKFTPKGGSITLKCEATPDRVRISVIDTGPGIPPDKLHDIFEPFVQVDRALNRIGHGAGLGLAISRNLARGMGGDIRVASKLGSGSTFTLDLPRTGPPVPEAS